MANFDVNNDTTPANTRAKPSAPTIAAMRTALNGFSGTTYPNSVLDVMSENDMIYACRVNGLTLSGALPK